MGRWRNLLVILFVIAALAIPTGVRGAALFSQTSQLLLYEAQTVYFGNLERVARGIPPLRWNRELTNSARWFSWDSVENRADVYCGHQDSAGGWPGDRNLAHGYYGYSGAENAYCGFMMPQDAIDGWMNSPGHRDNLLDAASREIGLGYYQRAADGHGYITQDFGQDPLYAPVIINNEALNTTTSQVELYIYSSGLGGGFNEASAPQQMRISNTPCLEEANWQPYNAQISWTLFPGEGWRSVYTQIQDAFGRSFTASDVIYQGASVPLDQLGDAQMSQTLNMVTLYNQPEPGYSMMQYSLGWAADDTYSNFTKWWGLGERVSDPQAWGGTAYRMIDGDGDTFAWVWTTDFYTNVPMVAYFRLKVSDNTSSNQVARIAVEGGSSGETSRSLRGVDFEMAGEYQEFAIPFTFVPAGDNVFLMFKIWRSGQPDVYFDAVTIFSASLPASSPKTLQFSPPFRYRGQTLWLRWLNAQGEFSDKVEGITHPPSLAASPTSVSFLAGPGAVYPSQAVIATSQICGDEVVAVSAEPGWLQVTLQPGLALLTPVVQGLSPGEYSATLTFDIPTRPETPPVQVSVRLVVSATIYQAFLPVIRR